MALLVMASTQAAEKPPLTESETKTPTAVLTTFFVAWQAGDYSKMYLTLSSKLREQVAEADWEKAWRKETRLRGLPKSYALEGPETDTGNRSLWKVKVEYRNTRVGTLTKSTWVIEEEDGWRVDQGGLWPSGLDKPKDPEETSRESLK